MEEKLYINMKKEKRTPFEIQRDINEAREKMASAVRSRNYPMTQVYSTRIAHLTRELEDVEADAKFFAQERNQDPALTQWAGKTLALTLNMADLAIYYYDLYMEYFARRGFTPVPEWQRKARRLKEAASEFREFTAKFFQGANIDAYFGQMGELLDGVARRCYTDRERKYLEEYEQK